MKKFIYSLLLISIILSSCSDSFLDRTPEGDYNVDNYYTSDEALTAATAPLYNRAWFNYNERCIIPIGSLRANEAYNPYMYPEFTTFQVTALTPLLSSAWSAFYSVVTMSNSIIENVNTKSTNDVTESAKLKAVAEARLMRGIAYFNMVRLWGPVILFENNETVVNNPIQPLHKEEDVFQFIINDLTYAANNLPEKPSQKGRATSWAAKGFLAKVYLARSGWDKSTRDQADLEMAKTYAADVCENSGLNLLSNYEDLFKYKFNNNDESLLAMQWVPLGDWYTKNTLYADLCFSSEITGGIGVWGAPAGTLDQMKQYVQADTLRRNASFFTNGSYYPYINIAEGGYTYTHTSAHNKKGCIGGPDDDNDGKVESMSSPLNTYLIRLADVYLIYAEACLGNSESLSSGPGLEYFNKLHDRAKIARLNSITLDDIIRERRCEFAMEFVNWYDMTTWYKWKPTKMLQYFNSQDRGAICDNITKDKDGNLVFGLEDGSEITRPNIVIEVTAKNIFFPYPESDVIQNPLLNEAPQSYNFNE
ncbi:RagB/SusD family nutrient uptake outer membrane protein [Dysgonomonas macrotermitis]|uniref:Starch-binding associating with outer membrane n=1 Tax=Dysgonomonas macrotermitis TaxID=1346286 RepID=A0A1M4VQ56_9BACT|nr:RagB/SusD family nutrient uptake outer membrane protein [Dysgonomonas macrotermitis]SHE70990.1 Starch-binding associating with outer membrane [Dysgonomonas macrotermitis]